MILREVCIKSVETVDPVTREMVRVLTDADREIVGVQGRRPIPVFGDPVEVYAWDGLLGRSVCIRMPAVPVTRG